MQLKGQIIFLGLVVILVTAFLFAMGNAWLGWGLVIFFLLFSHWYASLIRFRSGEVTFFVIMMYCHIGMAVLCCYFLPQLVLAFGVDSNGFVREALQQAPFPFGVGVGAYVNFLKFFTAISPAMFTLYMTSLVAVMFICLVLREVTKMLSVREHFLMILVFSTLVPTDIILTSIALREPWQMLFLMACTYFAFRMVIYPGKRIPNLVGLLVSLMLVGILHRGLLYVAIVWPFVFFLSLWFMRVFDRIDAVIKVLVLCIGMLIVGMMLVSLSNHFASFTDVALTFSGHIPIGGSTYTIFFQPGNSALTNLFHLPLALLYYWFYPFPWDIHRVKDIYGCLVGLMRLFFILYAFYFVLTSPESRQRHLGGALLVVLLMISMIFAIGTSNYGTSLRHNILTFWGFVALGIPGFYLHRYRYRRRCRRLGVPP